MRRSGVKFGPGILRCRGVGWGSGLGAVCSAHLGSGFVESGVAANKVRQESVLDQPSIC